MSRIWVHYTHQEAASEMLQYVVMFSELIKMANLYSNHALDTEKREIATQVFTELVFEDKKLVNYVAKDGYKALLERHANRKHATSICSVSSGSAVYILTELPNIYQMAKISMEKLKKLPFLNQKTKQLALQQI